MQTLSYLFLPVPRRVDYSGGTYLLPQHALILLDAPRPLDLRPAAVRIQSTLYLHMNLNYALVASLATPPERIAITLRVAPERVPVAQGYRLHITPGGILIEGKDPAGVFYGACTLVQILQQQGLKDLPCLEITDWPDIPARGVMLDVSRDRVPTMETLFELVDRLAGWKINQLQLYTEHTFAYQNHPVVWQKASPMTAEEVMNLDAYCRERFIELVPNQNSFGHMERWLIHPQYADLAETHGEFDTPWGVRLKGPFSLAPEHPGSIALIRSLYDELLPHFTSKMFNVGCDETIDVGQGVSKEIVEKKGAGQVYFDFLMKIYTDVQRRGYTMQFWGDIINNDHPELAAMLPRDVIALNWGYEADHPFNVECQRFAASGVPFYVCPGTSTWCSIAGRTDNAIANLLNAAQNGIAYGAIGFLNTDWGDRGHWQVPPVSYLGYVVGAAYAWALEANRMIDIPALVSRFAFEDPSGVMGRLAYDLGNVYQTPKVDVRNGNPLFWILQYTLDNPIYRDVLNAQALQDTAGSIMEIVSNLNSHQMARYDADLIQREFGLTARLLLHACQRGLFYLGDRQNAAMLAADMEGITTEYRDLWLARSRPGGLEDSVGRLERAGQEYLR